jgi:hypothetical protein
MSAEYSRASGSFVEQESDCAEAIFLILPARLEIVFAPGPQSRQAP